MLTHLRIENLALVESLTWEPGAGLVAVTGETGAGKSVILGALGLVLGDRADRSLLRSGTDQCTVEAVFELPDTTTLDTILVEAGIEPCDGGQLVLKRTFTATGSNRQFANCSPATLQVMRQLGDQLVDLHGPHDHQSLLSRDRQLGVLNAWAGAETDCAAYATAWQAWQEARRAFEALRDAERASQQEIELLRHQIHEIDAASLRADEEADLVERYRRSANRARLAEAAGTMAGLLSESEECILDRLGEVQRLARELEKLDPSVAEPLQGLATASVELEELARTLARYLAELDLDPAGAQALEDRVNLVESLKRKYGATLADVIAWQEQAAARLAGIENRDQELARLESAAAAAAQIARAAAARLSAKRRKAAPKLAREISSNLADLGFARSEFEVVLASGPLNPHGAETVDFLFMPNPGEPAKPLRLIASSGEISRVMLAVKAVLADHDAVPVLLFDEIDANVGGEIATAVGTKLASLARTHQVVTITHLPQVACQAGSHFLVTKETAEGRTRSLLQRVEGTARIDELARMLGGRSKSALDHARSLLSSSARAQ